MSNKRWFAAFVVPFVTSAQDIPLDLFSSLSSKAAEKVEVTLDSNLLQLAAKFLDDKDPEDAKVKNLLNGLKGVYVRSLTFKNAGEYSQADVDKMRAQLKGWSQIVDFRSASENTGVYLKMDGQKVQGMVVVAAEPTELTVVNISGSIDPSQLKDLSGKFGIPDLGGVLPRGQQQKKKEE